MKIPSIKKLAEQYSIDELKRAELSLLKEETPEIEIEGSDEGEQLTHILAALEIREQMETAGLAFPKALRNYTLRVRNSIS